MDGRLRALAIRSAFLFLLSLVLVAGFWYHREFYQIGFTNLLIIGGFVTFLVIWAARLAMTGELPRGRASGELTFTLDEATVDRLRRTAARVRKPQSQVVREAVKDYAERVGKLSEEERTRLLKLFDTVVPAIPLRPVARVDAELRAIRAARRRGGRRQGRRAR